ncbi:hypothetical protein [Streptomyces flaveolus]|uniref:hypothetical protein n=1 Tax=Streptomyces flaveolus TaxID=67297 RepID=UPI00380D6636
MKGARDTTATAPASPAGTPRTGDGHAAGGEAACADRAQVLEDTLRDVLSHIRPQGHLHWELNTCLVTNDQLTKWWAVLGVTPQWHTADQ